MTDNRFADCTTVNDVLWRYHECARDGETEYGPPALARIAELTPPKDENLRDHAEHILRVHGLLNPTPRTVDEAGRERAIAEARKWWNEPFDNFDGPDDDAGCPNLVDRIIDALGWTAAEPDPDADLKLKPGEVAPDWSKLLRSGVHPIPAPATPAEPEVRDRAISGAWLSGLMSWNIDTFGPGLRTEGVTDHIARELDEIRKAPTDLTEWADVILLALAGAVRAAGAEGEHPRRVIDAVLDKHQRNLQRKWPDWRTAERGKAIEHVRDTEPADAPHQCADVADDCCERTPAPATPAVELDVTALERIRAVLNCHENTRAAMDKLPMFGAMPDITIPSALPMRITTNPFGVSVLQIGGGQ